MEWMHHRHQQHQLEEALHEESVKNHAILDRSIKVVDRCIVWLDGLQRELIKARGSQDKRGFVYPEGPEGELGRLTKYSGMRVSVWRTGQTTGLLPRETAQFYARLYAQFDKLQELEFRMFEATQARNTYQATFASVGRPSVPDILEMTRGELIAYTLLVENNLAAARDLRYRFLFASGATDAILNGASTDEDVIAAENAAIESHPDPTAGRKDKPPAQIN